MTVWGIFALHLIQALLSIDTLCKLLILCNQNTLQSYIYNVLKARCSIFNIFYSINTLRALGCENTPGGREGDKIVL